MSAPELQWARGRTRTGCPRGAPGPAAAGGWMDGWQGCPAPASFGRADSLILAGRGETLAPRLCQQQQPLLPQRGCEQGSGCPLHPLGWCAQKKKKKQKNPTHPLLLFPLCWEMGAPGLAAQRLWGNFRQDRGEFGCRGPGKAGARLRARRSAGQRGGKELQIQQSPRELSAGKTCKRIEFSRCARFCRWQRHPRGEAPRSAPCQAAQGCSHRRARCPSRGF